MRIPPISLVIFDMDGLMLDTERVGWEAWRRQMEQYQLTMDFDTYAGVIGANQQAVRALALRSFRTGPDPDRFLADVWRTRMELVQGEGVPKKPGLLELLAYLKEQRIPCAVATSSDRASMEELLRTAGVYGFFTCTACGNEVTHSKPHPEIFLKAALKAGVPPQNALVLEDSANGIRAAHAAGMTGVFVKDLIDLPSEVSALAHAAHGSLFDTLSWMKKEVFLKPERTVPKTQET